MFRCKRSIIAGAGLLAATTLALTGSSGQTYAAFSDFGSVEAHASAGVWAPDPPAACGDLKQYGTPPARADAIVWLDDGDNVWPPPPPDNATEITLTRTSNHPQIIMGLGGDDILQGGNQGDCLVGGAGNDTLIGGTSKDILLGGPGDDRLDGGTAKDELDGEDGFDTCDGGNGKDTIVNCEEEAAARVASLLVRAAETSERAEEVKNETDPVAEDPTAVAHGDLETTSEETLTGGDPAFQPDAPSTDKEEASQISPSTVTGEPDVQLDDLEAPTTGAATDQEPASTGVCENTEPNDQNCEVKP